MRFWKSIWPYLIGFSILILVVGFLPAWITANSWFGLDFTHTGEIGDTLGGIMGPFIAVLAASLTFAAFWVQYRANQQQRKDLQIERFENKFYEILRLHKENVNETRIESRSGSYIEGRKAFVLMYNELRYAFYIAKREYNCLKKNNQIGELTDENILKLAYTLFYAGVGPNSDIVNQAMLGDKFDLSLVANVRSELQKCQDDNKPVEVHCEDVSITLSNRYKLFTGHMSRFGHYYRHLYQTVKFVVQQNDELIPVSEKEGYLRTLRAQLSDHEQVMLYYNALSGFGESWITHGYFTTWKMIHNLPLPLANFGNEPNHKFKDYIESHGDIFEWNGA